MIHLNLKYIYDSNKERFGKFIYYQLASQSNLKVITIEDVPNICDMTMDDVAKFVIKNYSYYESVLKVIIYDQLNKESIAYHIFPNRTWSKVGEHELLNTENIISRAQLY